MSSTTPLNVLRDALPASLQSAATAAGPQPWQASIEPAAPAPAEDLPSPRHIAAALNLSGALSGSLVLSIERSSASLLLGETADPAESFLALVRAFGQHLCSALSAVCGDVHLGASHLAETGSRLLPLLPSVVLRSFDEHTSVTIAVSASEALFRQLHPAAPTSASSTPAPPAPLHRVLDVPLAVTLRFGQRQLTLREVLELNTGSLVELDRQVDEPVDLMLGDRVIARGEVVIVDGNYGMRVTEVVETTPGSSTGRPSPPLRYANA